MKPLTICSISRMTLATNPRLVKELTALRDRGHHVRGIAGAASSWARQFDDELIEQLAVPIELAPFGPNTPLALRFRQVIVRKTATALAGMPVTAPLSVYELGHHDIVPGLTRRALAQPADLYIAHYPEALPAAAKAAARHGGRFAFDAEDYHLGDLPDAPEHATAKKIIRAIEAAHLPKTAFMTAASPLIAEAYARTYDLPPPTVILNTFPRSAAPAGPSPRGAAAPGPSVYWFSQTLGPGRGIELALAAMARGRSRPHLYLRGNVSGAYRAELSRTAQALGVAERLHFLSPESPTELERLGGIYDLGYVGELAATRNRQIALTNKLFSYLSSGLPVLASDIPAHRDIAPRLGQAISIFKQEDPDALANAIDGYLMDRDRLARARTAAWDLGQGEFSWEADRERLTTLIETKMSR